MAVQSHDPSLYEHRDLIPVRRALISVSDKTGLLDLAQAHDQPPRLALHFHDLCSRRQIDARRRDIGRAGRCFAAHRADAAHHQRNQG